MHQHSSEFDMCRRAHVVEFDMCRRAHVVANSDSSCSDATAPQLICAEGLDVWPATAAAVENATAQQ
jgi:hypothetical protein